MRHLKKFLLLIVTTTILLLSCSKDDDKAEAIDQNGGEAFRSQIVKINIEDKILSENEYQGNLGETAITLSRSEDNKLTFLIPSDTELGPQDLKIPALGNAVIHYNIKETVLTETVEATIAPLFINFDTFALTLPTSTSPEASNMQHNLDSFNTYYENASDADKLQIAIAYKANKTLIDEVILNDYSNVAGRFTNADKEILIKFFISVLSIDIGSMLAVNGGHPGVRALGIVIAGIATTSSINFYKQFIEVEVKEIGVTVSTLLGENNRNELITELTFQDGANTILPISTSRRKLTAADANATQEMAVDFFSRRNTYNFLIGKVNTAIQYINSVNPFFTFGLIQLAQLPSSATSSQAVANQEVINKFKFTVNNPNLVLEYANFEANGQIKVKIKIVGTPANPTVISTLNYSYEDEFSGYSGSFPIKVDYVEATETVIGSQTWMTTNLNVSTYRNGDPIPQIQDSEAFSNATTGAWCYYENNTANGAIYGKLYNKYAVLDPRGLAPVGWHVPNDAEWDLLIATIDPNPVPDDYAGVSQVAGGKMKATGTTLWQAPNEGATNITRFKAIPSGYKSPNGSFRNLGQEAKYWSRTAIGNTFSNQYSVTYDTPKVFKIDIANHGGLAVRCIKD